MEKLTQLIIIIVSVALLCYAMGTVEGNSLNCIKWQKNTLHNVFVAAVVVISTTLFHYFTQG